MKLYLGCAEPPFHHQHTKVMGNPDEWTWVDLYIDHPQVKKWDATKLDEVEDGSVEAIYASHLLEHFPHIELRNILSVWHRKLKKGGKVIVNVPDLAWACKQLVKYEKGYLLDGYYNTFWGERGLLSIFYGSESHDGEYHKSGFIKSTLRNLLKEIGFEKVEVNQLVDAHDMGVLFAEAKK